MADYLRRERVSAVVGKMSVMTISPNAFVPGGRKYQLAPNNIRNGDIAVDC